jgi:hypothetical protein
VEYSTKKKFVLGAGSKLERVLGQFFAKKYERL